MDTWEVQLLAVLLGLNGILLARLALLRIKLRRENKERLWMRGFMRTSISSAPVSEIANAVGRNPNAFIEEYMALADSVRLPGRQQARVRDACVEARVFPEMMRDLRSRSSVKRKTAAIRLSYINPDHAAKPLVDALSRERRPSVRLHIVYALTRIGSPAVIPTIIDSLAGSSPTYQQQIYGLLTSFGDHLRSYFPVLKKRTEPEIQSVVMNIAATRSDTEGREYLERLTGGGDPETVFSATQLLLDHYLHLTDIETLLRSANHSIVNLTLEAIGSLPPERSWTPLLDGLSSPSTRKSAVVGLSRLVLKHPELYADLLRQIAREDGADRRDALLEVASNRVEYLIEKSVRDTVARKALRAVVESGRVSGVLAFLTKNQDPEIERIVVDAAEPAIAGDPDLAERFALSAPDSVLERLSIDRAEVDTSRHTRVAEATPRWFIFLVLFLTLVVPPGVYALVRPAQVSSAFGHLSLYGQAFTLLFAGYASVLNLWYLFLTVVAGRSVRTQQAGLDARPASMLFAPGVLPSISVVAPAYNEEASIVESVNSLLGLRYPDFEVLVINDGSNDDTLQRLVDVFELDRVDIFLHGYLQTKTVRGVYRNPRIPELTVIDKQNGGKADSLNVGINASRKQYFAAIDADSLLERDSLLLAASQFLDSDIPVVATGGNIFPINGCRVSQGVLDEIHLPRSALGTFQVLEYLRSFMAGRTGWAGLRSLMIISGAFGLFRKKDVIRAHGYLTGSGRFAKDTVAEDMELVVRMTRSLRDAGEAHVVQYCYAANCWTEVPVTRAILRSQRDRWQRGLIDTMYFHRRMLMNPRYGTVGVIGFPYFFVFELLGPWIELQGLVFLLLGVIAGYLTPAMVLLVFIATIPLGIAVSIVSLILAEYRHRYFDRSDRWRLLLYAVAENFGYRQYASIIRLSGYVSALTRKTGWGRMKRTGFLPLVRSNRT